MSLLSRKINFRICRLLLWKREKILRICVVYSYYVYPFLHYSLTIYVIVLCYVKYLKSKSVLFSQARKPHAQNQNYLYIISSYLVISEAVKEPSFFALRWMFFLMCLCIYTRGRAIDRGHAPPPPTLTLFC